MEFSELAQFIDYKEMYKYIKSAHLEEYPSVKAYVENYLLIPFEELPEDKKNNVKNMYSFLTSSTHDDFIKNVDVCLETSFINSDRQILEIACFKKFIFEN